MAKDIEAAVNSMASSLHEEWRKTRLNADGSYEPRWKVSKDAAWNAAHGTDQCDIANTKYEDLPSNWQSDNFEAARTAVEAVSKFGVSAEAGSLIHEGWMVRNAWAKDDPEQAKLFVPYAELPVEEQEKDLVQARVAARFLGM